MTCSGPVPTHALAPPNPDGTEATLYNTAKRGYDKAKTHSKWRPGVRVSPDRGRGMESRDARATGVFPSRVEPPPGAVVSLTGSVSDVYLSMIATIPVGM